MSGQLRDIREFLGGIPPEGLHKMDVSGTELAIEDSPDLPPLWRAFGASKRPDGRWQLPALSVELASPDAALHIGPQHVVLSHDEGNADRAVTSAAAIFEVVI